MSRNAHRSRSRWGLRVTILAMLAALIALLGASGVMAANRWSDISDQQWVDTYHVTAAQAATVAAGYPDGTFKPALAVTRGQFAKMAVDGLGLSTATPAIPTFSDVSTTNTFYAWIEGGVDAGVISGFTDGTYRPRSVISRQQANSILGQYLSQKEMTTRGHIAGAEGNYASLSLWYAAEGAEILAEFADATSVSAVHAPYTAYLIARAVVQGSSSGGNLFLRPGSNLTRAQAVAMVLRVKAVSFLTALPTVTLLNPAFGPTAGGNSVVITGTNFTAATVVKFGAVNATSFVVNSATQITAIAPAGAAGTVDVTVTTPAGTSSTAGTGNDYTYGLPTVTALNPTGQATTAAGTAVTITGTGFVAGATVAFGGSAATSVVVVSSTTITCLSPAHALGTVDVTVTTSEGTSSTAGTANDYTYGAPTVTGLSPTGQATTAAGTAVIITGTNFVTGATVAFGTGFPATSVVVVNSTTITCVSPAHVAGVVDVTVTTPAGTSSTAGSGNDYAYGIPTVSLLSPNTGTAAGGTVVIITGTNFVAGATVTFGSGFPATSVAVVNSTTITCISPVHAAGVVDVVVTTTAGSSATAGTLNDYTYVAFTADLAFALTSPSGAGNTIAGGGATRAVTVNVVSGTTSVVFTGTKLVGQAVVVGGANAADVIAAGTGTAPTFTVNTTSVAAAGGSKVFTLTVSEAGKSDIVYTVTVTVAVPLTADVTFALTSPTGAGNSIAGGGATRPVTVGVVNGTTSVVLTGAKTVAQTVAVGGANAGDVIQANGGTTAPTFTVNTTSVAAAGGAKVFTLTVSEAGKANIVYTVTVTVAGSTSDVAFALTSPSGAGNSIAGGGATRTVTVGVVSGSTSVLLTGAKTVAQTVAVGGTDVADVIQANGGTIAPTFTVNTTSVAAAGGSKVFTLTVSESGKADIVYTVTVTVAIPFTADMTFALTSPSGAGNSIAGGGATRTVTVGVVSGSTSVLLTGAKTVAQTVAVGGTDVADVIQANGGTIAPTFTVNTTSVAAAGGSKVFTLTVSEAGKANIVYTVTVTVAIPFTQDMTFVLTSPTGGVNAIAGGGATRAVTVTIANGTTSVLLTGAKQTVQAVVVGGANFADVIAAGSGTAPTYTVNTTSVAAAGGSKVFTLTVSESGKADIVYTVTVNVQGP